MLCRESIVWCVSVFVYTNINEIEAKQELSSLWELLLHGIPKEEGNEIFNNCAKTAGKQTPLSSIVFIFWVKSH